VNPQEKQADDGPLADQLSISVLLRIAGSIHSHLSGDIGEFRPVSRNTGDPFERVVLQHQDHEGFVGHAVVFAPDPEARCGDEAEGWVVIGMAQDNKDIEVRKL
jgi:hypothetical protein